MELGTEAAVRAFNSELADFKNKVVATVNKHGEDLARLKQIGFRRGATDGGDGANAAGPPMLLETSAELQGWLRSARGKRSTITVQFPFEMKAATPILNAGGTAHFPAISGPQQPALRLAQLLPNIQIALGAAVEYSRELTYVPGAAIVPEGTLKPATNLTFENTLSPVRTLATVLKVSVQSLMDVPTMQLWLNARLMQSVLLAAEDLFLNAAAPDGLIASAVPLDPAYTPGTGATALDYIGGAIGQLQSAGYTVDGVVLSGVDASKMRLSKSTVGEYLWASPDSAVGVQAVWGVPTVISPKLAPGQFLVGAFAESTLLFVRQFLTVEISFENEDDFVRNLACLRAEERVALAIPVPAGLVKGTLPVEAAESRAARK